MSLSTLTRHRHDVILRRLEREPRVRVVALAVELAVSEETIRRDLDELEARGRLRRIHGGAVPFRTDEDEPLNERSRIKSKEKVKIGQIASMLVEDGMTVFVDTGSTPLAFARALVGRRDVQLITNSLDIAQVLAPEPGLRIKVTPGWLRSNDNALLGSDTIAFVRRFVFDIAVMGIAACDEQYGWMDYGEEESDLRRILYQQSRRNVVVCDESKFGRRASVRTFDLTTPLTVATNRPPPEPFASMFAEAGVEVLAERPPARALRQR
ncbi:MAG TPA: DeoR/GlpR family DNA-binding transcription regulator [Geminicoccus sp.]|jgi:DeoR family glycerol-3-phosphate regulon repressor|uniref:DeoR/GlpR family DNA-binding transcription regulator n=1 Tax=Geminicoccus sp. TaxID=2024832 RepID=UPI002E31DA7B|nr:DeoR/GlpR family DNA-binding transcription regulator [Geminicoccus sp.]HEX2529020.1 DeoR/GlpR family DNA-binding transcription regulator [Geminicoccus sp.]